MPRIRERYVSLLEAMVEVHTNSLVQAFRTAKSGKQCSKKLLCLDKFGNIRPVNLKEYSEINGKWISRPICSRYP